MNKNIASIAGLVAFLAIAVLLILHYSQPINLANADLGRHIKNGEVVVEMGFIPKTNLYSYTEPDHPMVTHHWGSGVVYYFIHQWFGFKGLSVLNTSLYLLAFSFFFFATRRQAGWLWAVVFSVIALPLITDRVEVRPEVFSYFFLGLYYYLLSEVKSNKLSIKFLWLLVPLQLLWVNLHIFFVMGIFLVGVFMVDHLLNDERRQQLKQYISLLVAMVVVSMVSPWGLQGVVEPFMIFTEYGYMVAENQSVLFMLDRFGSDNYVGLIVLSVGSLLLLLVTVVYKVTLPKLLSLFLPAVLLIVYGLLAWDMIRNFPLFGYFFIPAMSVLMVTLLKDVSLSVCRGVRQVAIVVGVIIFMISIVSNSGFYSFDRQRMGWGLVSGIEGTGKFCKAVGLKGPIFNNYDIGSYLVYYLYPDRKVFVDNRPEAYSVKFFEGLYNPMLADEAKWQTADQRFNFNAIVFWRHDLTEHGQPFLIRRIGDETWAPVFVDNYNIVLLKRNTKNRAIIERYELPPEMFSSSPNR